MKKGDFPPDISVVFQLLEKPGDGVNGHTVDPRKILIRCVAESACADQGGDFPVKQLCVGRDPVIVTHICRDNGIIAGTLSIHEYPPLIDYGGSGRN